MEDKESDNIAIDEINKDNENNYNSLLTKIGHKPIIMTSIYSFVQSRPYILFHLISKDQSLKSSLKDIFDNTQKENDLSKELIGNLNTYIIYRKIKDNLALDLEELKQKIFNNKKLNEIIQKPIRDQDFDINFLLNIFNESETENLIENFIDKNFITTRNTFLELYYESYSKKFSEFGWRYNPDIYNFNNKYVQQQYTYDKLDKKTFFDKYKKHIPKYNNRHLFNDIIEKELKKKNRFFLKKTSRELLEKITYYEYVTEEKTIITKIYNDLPNTKEKNLFFDKIISFYYSEHYSKEIKTILLSKFDKYPLGTKNIENYVKNL